MVFESRDLPKKIKSLTEKGNKEEKHWLIMQKDEFAGQY